jgi:hypothetical protein
MHSILKGFLLGKRYAYKVRLAKENLLTGRLKEREGEKKRRTSSLFFVCFIVTTRKKKRRCIHVWNERIFAGAL